MTDSRVKPLGAVRTPHLFDMVVDLDPPLNIGAGPLGQRVLFGSAGGTFEGPKLAGAVLAGGGDWALFRADGSMSLDVRLTLKTHDGALIHMTYGGRFITPPDLRPAMADRGKRHQVDPQKYYFRTNPLFETGASSYGWVNDIVCIGSGYLVEGGIAYRVWEVL
jgi:Protein of unknown function (DUF3237)